MKLRYGLIAAGTMALAPAVSMAQLTGNIGFMSDYVFRGVYQAPSSAMGGIDYAHDSGFYIGTWWADVSDGLEADIYFGFGGEAGDFSYSLGYTEYTYTDNFDSGYGEVNLGVGWSGLSLDVAVGSWDGSLDDFGNEISGTDEDYTFYSLGYEYEGFYVKFGSWDWDTAPDTYDYFEIGYGLTWEGIDFSMALINSSDQAFDVSGSPSVDPDGNTLTDNQFVFSISRSFTFGE